MKERTLTALALIAIASIAIALGNVGVQVLIFAFIGIACYEVYDVKKDVMKPLMVPIIALFAFAGGLNLGLLGLGFYIILLMMTLFILSIAFEWFGFDEVSYTFIMTVLIILAVQSIQLVLSFSLWVLLYIFIATFATDTFAYLGGSFFGKTKLIERISPKKTVEGALIGYVASVILSITFGHFMLVDILGYKLIITLSLLIPILSQVGDLSFSLIKRHFHVKDFGKIFPGHGGVLDRIDSVVFSLLTFSMVISVFARFLWLLS